MRNYFITIVANIFNVMILYTEFFYMLHTLKFLGGEKK